jgi:hypothetical protein
MLDNLKVLDCLPSVSNPNFMGREMDLNCLDQSLKPLKHAGQRIAVIYAIGGMGKTELVLEYAHQHRHEFSLVFWVSAASPETATAAFRDAAQRMVRYRGSELCELIDTEGHISDKPEDGGQIVAVVKGWFAERGDYLVVFDNYDDLELFDIRDFMPIGSGSIIITSRRPESRDLGTNAFELGEMDEDSSVELFKKVSGSDNEPGKLCYCCWVIHSPHYMHVPHQRDTEHCQRA